MKLHPTRTPLLVGLLTSLVVLGFFVTLFFVASSPPDCSLKDTIVSDSALEGHGLSDAELCQNEHLVVWLIIIIALIIAFVVSFFMMRSFLSL